MKIHGKYFDWLHMQRGRLKAFRRPLCMFIPRLRIAAVFFFLLALLFILRLLRQHRAFGRF